MSIRNHWQCPTCGRTFVLITSIRLDPPKCLHPGTVFEHESAPTRMQRVSCRRPVVSSRSR